MRLVGVLFTWTTVFFCFGGVALECSGSAYAQGSEPGAIAMGLGGTADSQYDHSVFMAVDVGYKGNGTYTAFSAVRERRCLLTANHNLIEGEDGFPVVVFQGQNLHGSLDKVPRQTVARGLGRLCDLSGAPPPGLMSRKNEIFPPYSDVAILWLEDRTGPNRLKKYIKLDINEVEFMQPNSKLEIDTEHSHDDKQGIFVGYGLRGPHAQPPDSFREQIPTTVRSYSRSPINASEPVVWGAGYWAAHPTSAPCEGDSGGPLILDGKVIGILSGSPLEVAKKDGCIGRGERAIFSALTSYKYPTDAPDDSLSNYGWVMQNVDYVCTKFLVVLVAPDPHKAGKVMGDVQGSFRRDREKLSEVSYNGRIDTARDDYYESITEEMKLNTITAIPRAGYKFVRWQGVTLSDGEAGNLYNSCPCDGLTTPYCAMTYDSVGFYSQDTSDDYSSCFAVFAADEPAASPPGKFVPPE
jgi:hypothetical protein